MGLNLLSSTMRPLQLQNYDVGISFNNSFYETTGIPHTTLHPNNGTNNTVFNSTIDHLTTTTKPHRSCELDNNTVYYTVACIAIIILVIFCNSVIIYKFRPFTKRIRPNIELLIIYLSVFDLMASVMLITDVYELFTCYKSWPLLLFGCKMIYPLYHISLNMSVAILLIMSIDRCRSISSPMKQKFSKRSIHTTVFITFVFCVCLQWYQIRAQFITEEGQCHIKKRTKVYMICRLVSVIVRDLALIAVFTVTSTFIYRSLLNTNLLYNTKAPEKRRTDARKVVIMLLLMEIVFTVLVVPYDVFDCFMLLKLLSSTNLNFTPAMMVIDRVFTLLQMSNSFANCFIYAKMHQHLRKRRSTSTVTQTVLEFNKKSSTRSTRQSETSGPVYCNEETM